MSSYQYLPYLRRGAATFINQGDAASAPARFATDVELVVNGSPVSVPVSYFGPADVAGLSPTQISRRMPAPNAAGVESNYFPHIELKEADLPWRFTPTRAATSDRLRPWLVLITLEQQPGLAVAPATGGSLPSVEAPIAELPDLRESYLWAHVQVSVPDTPPSSLEDYVAANPRKALARLISPRRLQPNTDYLVCLVPAFEAGRLAGLNDTESEQTTLARSWEYDPASTDTIRLPVYDHWTFSTTEKGDFESLARQLAPYAMPEDAGSLDFQLDPQLAGTDLAMRMEGALRPSRPVPQPRPPVPTEVAAAFVSRINRAADLADSGGDPHLAAPLYGRWQASQRRIGQTDTPVWLNELNTDPRMRVAAAAGGDLVQKHQEEFVAAAWKQVQDLIPVNQQLRSAQVARGIGDRLQARHFQRLPDDQLLQVAGPLLARVRATGSGTLYQAVAASGVPSAGFEGAFRRISRPRGPYLVRHSTAYSGDLDPVLHQQGMERGTISSWQKVDQGNTDAPSNWHHSGEYIYQTSNIYSPPYEAEHLAKYGTMYITGDYRRDVRFACSVLSQDDDAIGVVFRYRSASNYYRFSMDSSRRYRRLVKCVNGVFTTLWQDNFAYTLNKEYQIEIRAEGDRLRVYFGTSSTGNSPLCDVRDSSHASGKVGLYTWGNHYTRFRRIFVDYQTGYEGADLPARIVDEGNINTPSRWTLESGHFYQHSNIYREPQDRDHLPKLGTYLTVGQTWWRDYTARVTLLPKDNDSVGLMFRYRDKNNYYRFSIDAQRSYQRLVKVENGVFTVLWQRDIGYVPGFAAGYAVSIVVDGSRLRGYMSGDRLFDLRDRSHDRGAIALYSWGTAGVEFRNVKVQGVHRDGILERLNSGQFEDEMEMPAGQQLPMSQLRADFQAALDPHQSVKLRTLDRISLPQARTSTDPLEPERPALRLPMPLAPKLAQLAPGLLLPGINGIPDASVVMLETNRAFVAALMVGANHEITRELLWRRLDVDLKATVFHQFWDTRPGAARAPDIGDIHLWRETNTLEQQMSSSAPRVVFLIRSELIRRFPNAAIYLVAAVPSDSGRRPGTNVELPQFGGQLGEDNAYFGFRLSPAQVTGADGGLGWYLTIEQRSSAMRFGLDVSGPETPTAWSDLTWEHVEATPTVHSSGLRVSAPQTSPSWGRNGAHMAAITRQPPARVFIHADRLLSQDA